MDPNKLIRDEVEKTIRELSGNDTVPTVGVHILSEIMFCPRAGVLALESRAEDVGLDFVPAPALGGLPLHEVDKLTFALDLARQELKRSALFPAGAICAGGLAYLAEGLVLGLALGSGAAIFWPALRARYADYCLLKHRLKLAEFARRKEPDWNIAAEQEVNWWELQKAGFESVEKVEPLFDPQLRLAGKPWRVLQKGAFHVPVIRKGGDTEELRPQHYARLAAYSYLIQRCERAQASWGIVLLGNSDRGVAVPIRPEYWSSFRAGLANARDIITRYRENPVARVPTPRDTKRCKNCPLGKPKKFVSKTELGDVVLEPYLTADAYGVNCHSTCGDRFRWVAPHLDARRIGLMD